ncbi:MAG: YncE family protein [Novosphingobium sp.]|nr:YncE family protein [Novosphingobium sp.]
MALAASSAAVPLTAQAQAPVAQVMQVPGSADFIAIDGDTIWVTNRGRVEHWSRTQGKLAEVPIARPCGAMVIAEGSLWVISCTDGTLNRIDLQMAKLVATIPTGIPKLNKFELQLAAGAGSIWIATDAKGVISRVDPATNSVVATIPVDPDTSYLTFGFGAVWAVSLPQQTIQRIDPATNLVTKQTMLGKAPGFLAAGEGAVWVQEQGDGTVARIDPRSGEVTARVTVGANLKYGDIDTGGGMVWLRTTDDQTFAVIDPKTMTVLARAGKSEGSGALRYSRGGVWTSAHDVHTITWWPDAAQYTKK